MSNQLEEPPIIEEPQKTAPLLVEKAGLAMFWNAAFLPLKLIISFGASVILLRALNVQEVALYAKLTALLTLLGTFSDLGVERALPRFLPEVELRAGRAGRLQFLRNIGLIRVATILPFILLLMIFPGFFWDQVDLASVQGDQLPPGITDATQLQPLLLGIVAVMLLLGAAGDIAYQVLLTYFRQKVTNLIDILNLLLPILRSVLVVLLGVLGAIYGLVLATIISVIVSLWLMRRVLAQEGPTPSKAPPTGRNDPQTFWRRFASTSLLMQVVSVSAMLYDQPFVTWAATLLILDKDREALIIALVYLCFAFVRRMLSALVTPTSGVQTPLFSRLYAENRIDGLRTAYASLTKFLILVLFPAGIGLIIMSRNVLMLLFGQARREQVLTQETLPAVLIASAFLIVGLFGEAIISVAMNVLVVFEKHRVVLIARLLALISIPLYIVLIPAYGVVGAAATVAFTALASRTVALVYAWRELNLAFPLRFLARVAGATLAFAVIVGPLAWLLPAQPTSIAMAESITLAAANGALILLAGVIFFFAFRALGGIDPEDKQRFSGMRIPGIKLVLRYL